jgi:hypothetical protein
MMNITRSWAMPNKSTFSINPIGEFIYNIAVTRLMGVRRPLFIVDPFAGDGQYIRDTFSKDYLFLNDLNPEYTKLGSNIDGLLYLQTFKDDSVDIVIFDPPYSPRQISEVYKQVGRKVIMEDTQSKFWSDCKNEIKRILMPHGFAICCGWNSNGLGKNRGFEMTDILLVAHGGQHNDTIVTAERKISNEY